LLGLVADFAELELQRQDLRLFDPAGGEQRFDRGGDRGRIFRRRRGLELQLADKIVVVDGFRGGLGGGELGRDIRDVVGVDRRLQLGERLHGALGNVELALLRSGRRRRLDRLLLRRRGAILCGGRGSGERGGRERRREDGQCRFHDFSRTHASSGAGLPKGVGQCP
jgi:hypothetical protein